MVLAETLYKRIMVIQSPNIRYVRQTSNADRKMGHHEGGPLAWQWVAWGEGVAGQSSRCRSRCD